MDLNENKVELKRKITREAAIEGAGKYFDALYDVPNIHERKVGIRLTDKDGKVKDTKVSEYELPVIMEMAVLSLNDKIGYKFGDFSIDKETIKSIEIIF